VGEYVYNYDNKQFVTKDEERQNTSDEITVQ